MKDEAALNARLDAVGASISRITAISATAVVVSALRCGSGQLVLPAIRSQFEEADSPVSDVLRCDSSGFDIIPIILD